MSSSSRVFVRMVLSVLLSSLFAACVSAKSTETGQKTTLNRRQQARSLSISEMFRFPSEPCIGVSNRSGTCFTHSECTRLGGRAEGDCLYPFGVCCIFLTTCNNVTNAEEAYFVSPGWYGLRVSFPECKVMIQKQNDGICQLRLDFNRFTLPGPVLGECRNGFLGVTGVDPYLQVPRLCGSNPGQHMYLAVDDARGPIYLRVATDDLESTWEIKITQIACDSPLLAPAECLQYFDTPNGTLTSFNFEQKIPSMRGYLNNLQYAMCIRSSPLFCSVVFDTFPGMFSVGNGTTTLTDHQCEGDYVQFPLARNSTGHAQPSRICGSAFNPVPGGWTTAPLRLSTHVPIAVSFVSDNVGSTRRGFKLHYAMHPC